MKVFYLTLAFLLASISLFSQTSIYGKITDEETGEDLIYVNIVLNKNGVFASGGSTDFEGNYSIPVDPGTYEIKISYTGYPDRVITGVIVKAGQGTKLDLKMIQGISLETVVVTGYKVPLIREDRTSSGSVITSHDLSKISRSRKVVEAMPLSGTPAGVTIDSRSLGTDYYIDGIRVSEASILESDISLRSKNEALLTGTEATFENVDDVFKKMSEETISPEPMEPEFIEPEPVEAGLLTAGEWSALTHWKFWKNLLKHQDKVHQETWGFYPKERYKVLVTNTKNNPLPNAKVELIDAKGAVHWSAITDNEGKAELWSNLFGTDVHDFKIIAAFDGQSSRATSAKMFRRNEVNKIRLAVDCESFNKTDIVFIVDATGSMSDEIRYMQAELQDVIKQVMKKNKRLDIQTGSVFYRDRGDEYVTRVSKLSKKLANTIQFINEQGAGGGGDYPEAVHTALDEALKLNWRADAVSRIAFLLLDAPPHPGTAVSKHLQASIRKAAEKGIRIIPIAASGIDPSTEFLMKAIAVATNGTYVFITDDSGIGNPHLEPTVDDYEVENLNELMMRLIGDYARQSRCKDSNSKNEIAKRESNELNLEAKISFYPNPAEDFVMLNLNQGFYTLDILNVNGQLIKSISDIKKGETRISLIDFVDGVYILQFQKDNEVVSKKLVIGNRK